MRNRKVEKGPRGDNYEYPLDNLIEEYKMGKDQTNEIIEGFIMFKNSSLCIAL